MGNKILCKHCKSEIEDKMQKCPNCGKDCGPRNRIYDLEIVNGVSLSANIGLEVKDSSGFMKYKEKSKNKRAGKTGRKAKESLSIDRTNKQVTVKKHLVKEQNEKGEWETVHNERIESPAKHRPQSAK
jgi:hypothetical protein